MAWGLPPKYKTVVNFQEKSVQEIKAVISPIFLNEKFELTKEEGYSLSFKKKLGVSFLSVFSFARPVIDVFILITKAGQVTIASRYDYNSAVGAAFNDSGKQKKIISTIVERIEKEIPFGSKRTSNTDSSISPKGSRNQIDKRIR